MFVKLRISALDALKQLMLNNHPAIDDETTDRIYKTISVAENDEDFRKSLDNLMDYEYAEGAEGFDDLIQFFEHDKISEDFRTLADYYGIDCN